MGNNELFPQENWELEMNHPIVDLAVEQAQAILSGPGLAIVGSSRANGERADHDFYRTPRFATEEILKREIFNGVTWECACGDGAMSTVMEDWGLNVISSDLIDRGYGVQVDFLNPNVLPADDVDNILTNPPFKFANEFVDQAKRVAKNKFAFFLKTVFLESDGRYDMFQDRQFPLKTVYQFSRRVTLTKDGLSTKNKGMISYAWFVWDRSHFGKPTIEWIR